MKKLKRTPGRHNPDELCAYAAGKLKEAGFELVATSRQSEATYYRFPGRHGVIRVAQHRRRGESIGLNRIIAKITFSPFFDCSFEKIDSIIAYGIGHYMMNSAQPQPSLWLGKKGTWEDGKEAPDQNAAQHA